MSQLKGLASVVFPARDLGTGVAAWEAMLDCAPVYVGEDFALFVAPDGAEIGVSALPWVDHPLVFWHVDDIEAAHRTLRARGATALGEVADGSLAKVGTAEVTNGDPATGIVDVPGGRLAVVEAPDGSLLGLTQQSA